MDGNYYFSDSSYWFNFNGDIIMRFASDRLDEFCVEAGFVDWEILPQNEESPYYGDYVVRFIKGELDE